MSVTRASANYADSSILVREIPRGKLCHSLFRDYTDDPEAYNAPVGPFIIRGSIEQARMMSSSPNESSITPHIKSAFENVVRQLHLSPEEYITSVKLKDWVRKHKDSRYVPPYLLDLWGFQVDDELFGKTAKTLKRTA